MRIWQIDPANLTPYYNLALCQALAEQGHEVRYVSSPFLYDQSIEYPSSFVTDFHYFKGLNRPSLIHFPRLRKALRGVSYPVQHVLLLQKLRQNPPDIVHIQWSRLPVFDHWLIKQIQKTGIPVVHTVHDVNPLFEQGRFSGDLENVYSQVNALVVHTEDSRKRFLEYYPHAAHVPLYVIPHLTPLIECVNSQEGARRQLGIPLDVPVALFFGVIKPYKGLQILADAISLMHDKPEGLQVWVVGHPDSVEDQQLVEQLAQQPYFHARPGFVPSDTVWVYHAAADVIVFPYRDIFQSGALIQALGYGRAVIVTEVGGLPEAIDGNGWVIPPGNPAALAHTLADALSNRERLRMMGERSRQISAERFSPTSIAQQFLKLYEKLRHT